MYTGAKLSGKPVEPPLRATRSWTPRLTRRRRGPCRTVPLLFQRALQLVQLAAQAGEVLAGRAGLGLTPRGRRGRRHVPAGRLLGEQPREGVARPHAFRSPDATEGLALGGPASAACPRSVSRMSFPSSKSPWRTRSRRCTAGAGPPRTSPPRMLRALRPCSNAARQRNPPFRHTRIGSRTEDKPALATRTVLRRGCRSTPGFRRGTSCPRSEHETCRLGRCASRCSAEGGCLARWGTVRWVRSRGWCPRLTG